MSTSSSAILMFCGFCLVKPACLAWGFSCKTSSQPRRGWPRGGSQGRWRPESQLREDSVGRNGQRSYGGPHGGRPTSPTGRWRLSLCSYSCARHLWGKKWFNEKYFILKNTTNCIPPWWAHLPNRPMTLLVFIFVCSASRKKNWFNEKYFILKNNINCIHLID